MTDQYDPKTIKPSRGAPVRFKGRIIAETEWDTKDGCWMRFTVWETKGGAYIAVIDGDVPGKPDQVHCKVGVVEPIYQGEPVLGPVVEERPGIIIHSMERPRDETAMQIAVLSHFDWHDRAKAMLKRELGWSPYVVVA